MMRAIMAAQALTTTSTTPIACTTPRLSSPSLPLNTSLPCQKASVSVQRRNIISLGLASAVLGLDFCEKDVARAAARRAPAPPPGEKKDPNVTGVLAKVLASKKRKEAMKQAMAKQREMGKKVDQPPSQ